MFAAVQRVRKLEEATSPQDEVTPVYLLEEVFQLATSGPTEVNHIVEWTVRRLGNKSPVVKQKTLRMIKYICSKGGNDFRRAMARHSTAVRDLTHYRGEPDPFKGDVPNQKVRDMAKEAMEALFQAAQNESGYHAQPAATPASLQSRIQGFGSSSGPNGLDSSNGGDAYTAAPTSSSSSSRMQGFGNPRYESAAGSNSFSNPASGGGKVYAGLSALATSISDRVSAVGSGQRATSPQWKAGGGSGSGSFSAVSLEGPGKWSLSGALTPKRKPGLLGDAEANGYEDDDPGSYSRPAAAAPPSSHFSTAARGGSDGSEEERLVDRICTPGGVRAQPEREELRLFVESLASLDGRRVAVLLQRKMEGSSWQAALRAVCALEAIVQTGSSAACGEVAVHFQAEAGALRKAATSPQASLRVRARKVLQLIGDETLPDASRPGPASAAAAPAPAAPLQPEVDLIGGLLDADEAAPQQPHPAPPAPDLLGDLLGPPQEALTVASLPPVAVGSTVNGSAGLFSGLDLNGGSPPAAGAVSPPHANGTADMFGGLSLGGAGSLDGPLSPPPLAASSSGGLGDFFSSIPSAAPAAAPTTSSAGPPSLAALAALNSSSQASASWAAPQQHPQQQHPQHQQQQQHQMAWNGMQGVQMGYGQANGMAGMQVGGLSPLQMQQLAQLQQLQYMQQWQQMQQLQQMRATASPFQQHQQQQPFGGGVGHTRSGSLGTALSLDGYSDSPKSGRNESVLRSAGLPTSGDMAFGFVEEHIHTLKKK